MSLWAAILSTRFGKSSKLLSCSELMHVKRSCKVVIQGSRRRPGRAPVSAYRLLGQCRAWIPPTFPSYPKRYEYSEVYSKILFWLYDKTLGSGSSFAEMALGVLGLWQEGSWRKAQTLRANGCLSCLAFAVPRYYRRFTDGFLAGY